MRETDQALFNDEDVLVVDAALIEKLKARATRSPSRRFRLCLHRSREDAVQEMIVVHCRDNYSRPHAHHVASSMTILEGEVTVVFFDDRGNEIRRVAMGAKDSGKPFALNVGAGVWHMPVCTTAQLVFYETQAGPFERERVNLWAAWSPAEDDPRAIARYLKALGFSA
jgi:glucose-6-phosphate isomerase